MTTKPDGGPAFPLRFNDPRDAASFKGMSLRDYFAAAALQGLLANESVLAGINKGLGDETFAQYYSRQAHKVADAMLAERDK